jgi:hypothetical protein
MQHLVALDPQLGISAAEFVAAWNESEHAAANPATVDEAPRPAFLPLEVTVALISAAATIPATVIATFVSEYLKQKYLKEDKPKVAVTTITTPDGQPVLIIKREES